MVRDGAARLLTMRGRENLAIRTTKRRLEDQPAF
jgi:hypothetical protein